MDEGSFADRDNAAASPLCTAEVERERLDPCPLAKPLPALAAALFGAGGVAAVPGLQQLHPAPRVYMADDFLLPTEVEALRKMAAAADVEEAPRRCFPSSSFKDSTTTSRSAARAVDQRRTSSFLWLKPIGNKVAATIARRAAAITGLPAANVQPLQVVRYRDGQKFDTHHDSGELFPSGDVRLMLPARVVTVFVYLSDMPEDADGCTEFPRLLGENGKPLAVRPKAGRAVVFCNVRPETGEADPLLVHRARPVIGDHEKLGVNIWITDEPVLSSCDGWRRTISAMMS